MNNPQYFTKRSHLVLAILVAVLVFILLTLVAARIMSDSRPVDDGLPSMIATPSEQPSETTPDR